MQNQEDLILENMGLVKHIAKKFKPKDTNVMEEYIQCGTIGLWEAIQRHDPAKGKLTTIAWYYIFMEIQRFIKKENKYKHKHWGIKESMVSKHVENIYDLIPLLTEQENRIIQHRLSGLNLEEIATEENLKKHQVAKIYHRVLKKIRKAQ